MTSGFWVAELDGAVVWCQATGYNGKSEDKINGLPNSAD
ncbi:hypothetical protein PC116_g26284 [Phytophthora cactorum]|nr:hypothetical protein PC116_g26284 [Phytophthora cactorum]